MFIFSKLPQPFKNSIFSYLPFPVLMKLRGVSKEWEIIIQSELFCRMDKLSRSELQQLFVISIYTPIQSLYNAIYEKMQHIPSFFIEIIELEKKGILSNYNSTNLLYSAVKQQNIAMAKCLLSYGANPNELSAHEENELPLDELKSRFEPPIALAALHKDVEMAKLLIQYGADINLFHAERDDIFQLAEAQRFLIKLLEELYQEELNQLNHELMMLRVIQGQSIVTKPLFRRLLPNTHPKKDVVENAESSTPPLDLIPQQRFNK